MIDLDLVGAEVLWPDGLRPGEIALRGGVIGAPGAGVRQVDLRGYWVLPGIVDMHGDGFERHLAPRRGAMKDLGQGLVSVDAELAANGITTAMLAQFWSWEGGMRGPDFARRFLAALRDGPDMLTDCRVQLRFETHMVDDYSAFEETVAAHDVRYVVFNDHLPHAALDKGKRPPRLTGQALKGGRSPEAHLALMQGLHERGAEVGPAVEALAKRLAARGVLLGSHDDDTAELRQTWQGRGVGVSEFPETEIAARAAREGGGAIVLGAPNVVRGGSHSGNVSAAALVQAGLCDALASDYHYPALRQAVLRLVAEGGVTLEEGWALISARPAALLGLRDRGQLEEGRRADLVVMEPGTGRICATLTDGKVSFMAGEVAARFVA
ncbi:alpha-D-ribose 1-methylphosphonate 5-triphosphate diphosphatase [Shimia aestuarii]|uniref:Alpha-D-ribose 1-methylphosphonate 5-triphosphate diphosphatase n=1 Tax=Shimia aestuarii TaxID=254406 RepID=A0A1I4I2K4_9RHOB|nr:alpha-D-ribose 1-methylphosphonate 5-triphosphate diphosphatase [Shimia aestuarii]